MKAAICTRYGPPEVLEIRDVPKPVPRDDEVLVKVHASTVNSSDWFIRSGIPNASFAIQIQTVTPPSTLAGLSSEYRDGFC